MKRYYLYGAGQNCKGVIKFFGAENITAIIDSDEKKNGKKFDGIPIVSLQQYIAQESNEEIIITSVLANKEIAEVLEFNGIRNYYKCPYMLTGFYENGKDIVDKLELKKYPEIVCCSCNPISESIEEEVKKKDSSIVFKYIDRDNLKEVNNKIPILVTNEDDEYIWKKLNRADGLENVIDINNIYRAKYGFINKDIVKFRDIHKGKRCFIIGNGPSLRYTDLEKLREEKEICFGCNRIYLAYPNTNWRPDYYVAVDHMIIQNDYAKILELGGIRFVRHSYCQVENWAKYGIYEFRGLACPSQQPQVSYDILEGIYMGNTVVYDALQIALYMGFQEIYLLGVDMTTGIRYEDEGSHFYKSPDTKENLGTSNSLEARKNLGYAAEEIAKSGCILRNATRGGELEEVPRVDFDLLF
ncbi:MAG: DUF115 domain-containing protein [Lachnospiraceae bacterium]|nr:DUF115 domain-containing protein [Lachnospiraceae bacterium]